MSVIFRDNEGKRLDSDQEIVREISQGKMIRRSGMQGERKIYPRRIVFSECKVCRMPVAETSREMENRILVRCIRCYSPDIIKKEDIKRVYIPKDLNKDKTAKSKSFVKAGA